MVTTSRTLALTLLLLNLGTAQAAATDWRAKVAPDLLARVEQHGQAEFLVRMAEQADLSGAALFTGKTEKGRFVHQTLTAHAQRTQRELLAQLRELRLPHRSFWIDNAVTVSGGAAAIEAIARRDDVERLHLLTTGQLNLPAALPATAAPPKDIEPSIALVRAPEVWALGFRGQGVVVADHDVGVRWDHPALKEKYRGWDGSTATHAYNWLNAFPADPFCPDLSVPCDTHDHGTHTTGTMVGDDGQGNQIGMAPDAQWIACKSLLDPVLGLGTVPTYMQCMEWTIAPYPQGDETAADPAQAPHVVNNSWGCVEACPIDSLRATNEAVKAAGIVQVVSAGNDGPECSTIAFPLAIYESSFTIGSTTVEDIMSGFSSRGPVLSDLSMRVKPNVVAPGSNIRSSVADGGYASFSGTSMSSPHVSGLVALILSAEPELIGRVDEIRALIERTSVPIQTDEVCGGTGAADIPNNIFGHGRIDALAAVTARPQLIVTADGPAEVEVDQPFAMGFSVRQPDGAKLTITGLVLRIGVPAGLRTATSPPGAGGQTVSFTRDSLAPGEVWTLTQALRADLPGTYTIMTQADGDQVALTVGESAQVRVAEPATAEPAPTAPAPTRDDGARFGTGGMPLAALLVALLAALRRRSHAVG